MMLGEGQCCDCSLGLLLLTRSQSRHRQVLPQLQSRIPIERSQMRLRLTMPVAAAAETRGMLQQHEARIEAQELTHGDTQVRLCPKGPTGWV